MSAPTSTTSSARGTTAPRTGAAFRRHYDDLERHREALIERLRPFIEKRGAQSAYRRAYRLLNQTFRRSTLAQRGALLQSAACLIEVLERLPLA